jgi:hypothetical protein
VRPSVPPSLRRASIVALAVLLLVGGGLVGPARADVLPYSPSCHR